MDRARGYIYVMINPHPDFPGLVRVGKTNIYPEEQV